MPFDGPIDLGEAKFNVTAVTVDKEDLVLDIERQILRIALPTINAKIFTSLFPNFANKPQATAKGIRQSHTDTEGNVRTSSTNKYHVQFLAASRPFAQSKTIPVDLVRLLTDRFHPCVKAAFKELYPQHSNAHSKIRLPKCCALQQSPKARCVRSGALLHCLLARASWSMGRLPTLARPRQPSSATRAQE